MATNGKEKKVKYPVEKKRLYATGKGSLLDLYRRRKITKGIFCSISKRVEIKSISITRLKLVNITVSPNFSSHS